MYINWAFCTRIIWLTAGNNSVFQGFKGDGVTCSAVYAS
ncbi:MAG: hypothetical protein ACI8QG_001575, partial [Flavobacteriales bacterium]